LRNLLSDKIVSQGAVLLVYKHLACTGRHGDDFRDIPDFELNCEVGGFCNLCAHVGENGFLKSLGFCNYLILAGR